MINDGSEVKFEKRTSEHTTEIHGRSRRTTLRAFSVTVKQCTQQVLTNLENINPKII